MKFQTAIIFSATLASYTPFVTALPSASGTPSAPSASVVPSGTPSPSAGVLMQDDVSSYAKASAVCGNLGVMGSPSAIASAVPSASASVSPNTVRLCENHPLDSEKLEHGAPSLNKRSCYYGDKKYGCSRGYCWKKCGIEERKTWCWTTRLDAYGAWATCSTDEDCKGDPVYGLNCGKGGFDCVSCGCSCW